MDSCAELLWILCNLLCVQWRQARDYKTFFHAQLINEYEILTAHKKENAKNKYFSCMLYIVFIMLIDGKYYKDLGQFPIQSA